MNQNQIMILKLMEKMMIKKIRDLLILETSSNK